MALGVPVLPSLLGRGDRLLLSFVVFSKRLRPCLSRKAKERRSVNDVLVCGVRGSMQRGCGTGQKTGLEQSVMGSASKAAPGRFLEVASRLFRDYGAYACLAFRLERERLR